MSLASRPRLAVLAAAVSLLLTVAASTTPGGPAEDSEHRRMIELQREAVRLLEAAGRAPASRDEVRRGLLEAARRLEDLGAEPDPRAAAGGNGATGLDPELRAELRRAARESAWHASLRLALRRRPLPGPARACARPARRGGRAGPEPSRAATARRSPRSPSTAATPRRWGRRPSRLPDVRRVRRRALAGAVRGSARACPRAPTAAGRRRTTSSSRAAAGVALFDYDGDGRLDIYLVTAAELTPARERIPHRNVLYRNLGRMEVRGRLEEGRRGRRGLGQRRLRRRLRRRRAPRPLRHELGPEPPLPQPGRRHVRGGRRAAPASAAGGWSTGCAFLDADADGDLDLYVARYVETTWDDVVRARSGRSSGATVPASWWARPACPASPTCSSRTAATARFVEATEAHGLADPARAYGFGVVATDYDDDGWVDLFVANDSNPNFLYRNLGDGRFESVGLLSGVAVERRRRGPRPAWASTPATTTATAALDLVLTTFAHDNEHALPQPRRPPVRGRRAPPPASPRPRSSAWAGGRPSSTPTSTAGWTSSSPTATSSRTSTTIPQLEETYRQKNQLLLNEGERFRDVSAGAGAGLQVARVGRGLAVGDLDDDGDPDLVVSNMDDAPTLLENRQRTGPPLGGLPRRVARPQPLRDRRAGHGGGRRRRGSSARSAPAAATSRRATSARTSGWASTRARWTWRCACPAATAGAGGGCRPTGCTCSSSTNAGAAPDGGRRRPMKSSGGARCCAACFWRRRAARRTAWRTPTSYRPKLADARDACEPFLPYLDPGGDSFPDGARGRRSWRRAWRELGDAPEGEPDRGRRLREIGSWPPTSAVAGSCPSRKWPVARLPSLEILRARRPAAGARARRARVRRGAAAAARGPARGHGRRVPDHRDRGGPRARARPHRRALRHRRARAKDAWRVAARRASGG